MEFYYKKRRWKIFLLIGAILIGIGSSVYTNWLIKQMAAEERKNVELWAEATKKLAEMDDSELTDITFLTSVLTRNETIPIIVTDSTDKIREVRNIHSPKDREELFQQKELKKMKAQHEPIKIILSETETHYLYYRDSYLLRNLRYFPLVQLAVIFLFITVSYLAFSSSRKAEQNQVWVGMSKETAHQLGTPISSLMAWVELLKLKDVDQKLIDEFEKDTQRLGKIAERFSKIGSAPELVTTNVCEVIESTVGYLKNRTSGKVKFFINYETEDACFARLNAPLFSWVIENLCKNAVDAIEKEGSIVISMYLKSKHINIDVSDTGKGIPKSQFKTIFEPGFTTKKRGWGLGLSLAKRIVENYHNGKIFIKHSELGKGTTFRIILNR
ncbi:MAG: histidine kinase [Bacteroidetes bacterium GWF2_42_66]|nr:MAG: histidine kinase [Bacteroidetes bacterium GWA2_42_15]OFY02900.1 MAG: histidine kinase [Bacteroidetes bacterium GWE2_42_39]OFY44555.1 MAG: histidine kinase [Bacteroidetes bacterium GWF2_42_66]